MKSNSNIHRLAPLFGSAALLLTGCTSLLNPGMSDAGNYYMDQVSALSKRQLLQNIAQVVNGEPAYFVQVGNFEAHYTLQETAGTNYGATWNNGAPPTSTHSAVTVTPSIGVSYSSSPTFTFTPLSGDAVTKVVFSPISKDIFLSIFNVYHADVAVRTTVEQINMTVAATASTAEQSYTVLNDPLNETFPLFVAIAYEMHKAQRSGLSFRPSTADTPRPIPSSPQPVAPDSGAAGHDGANAAAGNRASPATPIDSEKAPLTLEHVKLAEVIDAESKGYNVSPGANGHGYVIGKEKKELEGTVELSLPDERALAAADCPVLSYMASRHEHMRFYLRSFDLMIYRIGSEDRYFRDPPMPSDEEKRLKPTELLPIGAEPGREWIPAREKKPKENAAECLSFNYVLNDGPPATAFSIRVRPLLRLTDYKSDKDITSTSFPLGDQKLEYHVGNVVDQGDSFSFVGSTPSVPNKIPFTLLAYIFAQAAIDSSKLPAPQLIVR